MSTELESNLREMLRTRATDLDMLPGRLTRFDEPTRLDTVPHGPHRRRWLLAAAAAALILAVTGAVVGIRQLGAHHARPAGPNTVSPTSPSPSPTTSQRVTQADGLHAAVCTVALPEAWHQAIDSGTVSLPGYTLQAMAISPSGVVVADASKGHQHKLVLVQPNGTIRPIYASENPPSWGEVDFGWAAFSGPWVVFSVLLNSHQGGPGPTQLDLINTQTDELRVARPSGASDVTIVTAPTVFNGKVYWAESKFGQAEIREYDIATATARTLAKGDGADDLGGPVGWGGGLYWYTADGKLATDAAGQAPPDFVQQVPNNSGTVIGADGAYAWIAYAGPQASGAPIPSTILSLWRPGMAEPLTVAKAPLGTPALSLPYLMWRNGGIRILDTQTGAVASVGKSPAHALWTSSVPAVLAAGDHVALEVPDPDGTFELSSFSTTGLPGLHC